MQRYFATYIDKEIKLSDDDVHHIIHVMRMKIGDHFELVIDNQLYICEITSLSPLSFSKEAKEEDAEIKKQITLFFALAKGDKIDLVIQKATELGAHRIILFKSKRCVVNFDNKDIEKKLSRYRKIAKEASEQCHRLIVPEIVGVVDIKDVNQYLSDINLLAYEKLAGKDNPSLEIDDKYQSVSIMIGSEGGFEKEEIDLLIDKGFKTISLGKRILRCETAAIYALSVLAYNLEK